jgi:GNAT superfamily N-acetyltransferase
MHRISRTDDVELIIELQRRWLPTSPVYAPAGSFWWVVEHGFKVVGFAGYTPCDNHIYLCRAAVDPNHRGRGLHKRLIRARLAHARKGGWKKVVTDTRDNPPSSNNLIECGFRMYTPEEPWGYKDACYWHRNL